MRQALILLAAAFFILRPPLALASVRPVQPLETLTQAELLARLQSDLDAGSSAHLESLTQEEAVRTALERHPYIQRAQARVAQARTRLADARHWFRPKVSVYAGERLDAERHRIGIQITHDLDDLWNWSRARIAEAELVVAEQDLTLTRHETVAETVAAHNGWILAREERRRMARRVEHARQALARGRERYEEGLISRAQLADLEQTLETAERLHQEAFARLIQSAVRLRQSMGELGAP